MGNFKSDTEIEGQMTIDEILEPPERLFAVSNIFSRARRDMSLNEQKAFVYALTEMKFTEEAQSDYVKLEKKVLAKIIGLNIEDTKHLSQNLYDEIKELPRHSYIEIAEKDLDFYSNGFVITSITKFKNIIRLRFNKEYIGLFTNLSANYITMWSKDIFQMGSKRSVQFYELLRQMSYPKNLERDNLYSYGWGIKAFKEMFDIPKAGKGSYMRDHGGFDRTNFERRVLAPICEDLTKCKMIQLVIQPNGKPYQKVKEGNRISHYQFYWTFSLYPKVATASEVKDIQEKVDKNPQILKIAKDVLEGQKHPKKKKNSFNDYEQRDYMEYGGWENLEQILLKRSIEKICSKEQ